MYVLCKYNISTQNEGPVCQTVLQLGSLSSVPAGRWRRVLVAASAAPGRVSACAGGAAFLGSPARTQAPARLAGRQRTPAAPAPHPRPEKRTAGQQKQSSLTICVAEGFGRPSCDLDQWSYLGQWGELHHELRENPQGQQANLEWWGERV